jgi:hypothetical protein
MRNLHNKELKDSTLLIWVAIIIVGHGKSKATNNLKELKATMLLIVWAWQEQGYEPPLSWDKPLHF